MWRGARWRQLCRGYGARRVEEKTNESKKRYTRLSRQAVSDSPFHCPQSRPPPPGSPTLLIPVEVYESVILKANPPKWGIRQSL